MTSGSIGEQGYCFDKAQWIGKFADFAYTSLESSDVEVCCYGHAAIVRCVPTQPLNLARAGNGVDRSRQPDLGRAARGLAAGGHSVQLPWQRVMVVVDRQLNRPP